MGISRRAPEMVSSAQVWPPRNARPIIGLQHHRNIRTGDLRLKGVLKGFRTEEGGCGLCVWCRLRALGDNGQTMTASKCTQGGCGSHRSSSPSKNDWPWTTSERAAGSRQGSRDRQDTRSCIICVWAGVSATLRHEQSVHCLRYTSNKEPRPSLYHNVPGSQLSQRLQARPPISVNR